MKGGNIHNVAELGEPTEGALAERRRRERELTDDQVAGFRAECEALAPELGIPVDREREGKSGE